MPYREAMLPRSPAQGTAVPEAARRGSRVRLVVAAGLIVAAAVVALTVPLPTPAELRAFAEAAGPAMPLAFFGVYALCTALPLPRTVFSLASGLLLGTVLGILVALAATTAAAGLGFLLARALGRPAIGKHLHRSSVRVADARIAGNGVLGITSLRLIPVIPFAPLSYCCGLSSVRLPPYLLGTLAGSLPGTAAVVILGDALTGATSPALVACYTAFALVGALGVYRMARRPAQQAAPQRLDPVVAGAIGLDHSRQYTRPGA